MSDYTTTEDPATGDGHAPGAKRTGLRLTMHGIPYDVDFGDYGPRDAMLVREETRGRLSLRSVLSGDTFDLDSLAVIWWLARRNNGERNLRLGTVFDDFPTYKDLNNRPDLVQVEELWSDDDGEEAVDADGERVVDDSPLPNAGD